MERKYSVYIHQNKINGKRYIGLTSMKVEQRWRLGDGYRNQLFGKAIEKYGWDNFTHIVIEENLTCEEAEKLEIELIKKYQTQNSKYGYNIADGGGATSPSLSNKVYQYDFDGRLLNCFNSQGLAEKETNIRRDLIGKACSGKQITAGGYIWSHTELTKEQIVSLVNEKSQIKLETIKQAQKKISMSVQQIDPITLEIIATYPSQREASRVTGIDQKGISKAISGKYKQSGGFIWRKG